MYDNFDMPRCIIVNETYNGPTSNETESATVKFIAEMILRETGERTSFMETSIFEKAPTHGAWLYLNGTIEAAPGAQEDGENIIGNSDDNNASGRGDSSIEQKLASLL
jgi:hypothetical protein